MKATMSWLVKKLGTEEDLSENPCFSEGLLSPTFFTCETA